MTRRKRIAIAVAAVATTAAALWWWSSDRAGSPAPQGRAGLAAGEQRAYDLTWDGTSVADASGLPGGADAYAGEVEVRARLVVRGLGRDGDATLVGYRLEAVETAVYRVLGQDVLAGVDATVGELVAALGPDGGLRELRPDPAAAPAADMLLRSIAQQSVVTLADGASWNAVEPGPSGLARMRYRRGDAAGSLVRTRTGYVHLAALPGACATCREQVDGVAAIALDRAGVLRDLVDEEKLVVVDGEATRLTVDSRFTLHLSSATATTRAMPELDGRQVVAAAGAGFDGDAGDLERARDWSLGRIGTTIIRFLASGATPGETTWMHGVAAYLRVHPEACTELLRMFAAPGLPAAGRDLIASMLVAAGTPAAQAALRDGIDWLADGAADAEVASVLSRASLLDAPVPATATWLAGLRDDPDHPATSSAATLALGAAIGNLADPAEAARHAAALADELADADDPAVRVELLAALGNGGRADDAAAITALATDPDSSVRHQVTLSVRKLDDAAAVPALTALAGDTDGTVRAAAIDMLGRRSLDPAAAQHVAATALAAGVRGDDLGAVIHLLAPHAADPTIASTLRSLLDIVDRPELRALIHHALS